MQAAPAFPKRPLNTFPHSPSETAPVPETVSAGGDDTCIKPSSPQYQRTLLCALTYQPKAQNKTTQELSLNKGPTNTTRVLIFITYSYDAFLQTMFTFCIEWIAFRVPLTDYFTGNIWERTL